MRRITHRQSGCRITGASLPNRENQRIFSPGLMKSLLPLLASLLLSATCSAASVYPTRLDDPAAVYLTPEEFHVHGDGKEDDSEAVQAAIDKVQASKGEGIVFVPQGRYRLTRTIYLWPGVRLI